MGKYFGTDGFRGEANRTLTVEHAFKIGRFIGWYYGQQKEEKCRVVIGKDTRRSSYMFEYSLEMCIRDSAGTTMMLSVAHATEENLYDYVDTKVVPEIEKISSVASVDAMGGSSEYVKVELMSDMMAQYGVTMSDVVSAISSANLAYPSGETVVGNQELSVTTSLEAEEIDDLKDIPITLSSGQIIHVSDVAQIYLDTRERGGASKYNGQETISISITKQQDSSAMDVSDACLLYTSRCV